MRHNSRILFVILSMAAGLMVFSSLVYSDQAIFGPKTYTRAGGPPQVVTDNFSAVAGSGYKLVVTNNGLSDSADESAADSFVYLNGESVVGTQNFSQGTQTLDVPVTLQADNTLEAEVRGAEGGNVSIQIVVVP